MKKVEEEKNIIIGRYYKSRKRDNEFIKITAIEYFLSEGIEILRINAIRYYSTQNEVLCNTGKSYCHTEVNRLHIENSFTTNIEAKDFNNNYIEVNRMVVISFIDEYV